jgi:hypothetical protein
MKYLGSLTAAIFLFVFAIAGVALGEQEYASMNVTTTYIQWQPLVSNGGVTLSITGPHDVYIGREFKAGSSVSVGIKDDAGNPLPDGEYSYQLEFTPSTGTVTRSGNESYTLPPDLEPMSQSGAFRVVNGRFLVPSNSEETVAQPQASGIETPMDQVIADDLIVQGSACIGFDCVNNESFGFDTVRLKENNTRIKFDDTSTSAGFPSTDWQLTANDSASGGQNKFSIEDITAARVPFTIEGGTPNNSLYLDSTGRIGLRTAAPVLDLHINTNNTPGIRLEQNNSGGFSAQSWDIAANETNFFVRDVTSGSRLPFRIRPGAPTSSIDISSSGNVGIGTASPAVKLVVNGAGGLGSTIQARLNDNPYGARIWVKTDQAGALGLSAPGSTGDAVMISGSSSSYFNGGNVGIGTTSPQYLLDVNGQIRVQTTVYSSSRTLKDHIVDLKSGEAMAALDELNPVKFNYKNSPDVSHIGFIAEDVPDLVAQKKRDAVDPMDIVAVLTKVVQKQNKTIGDQEKAIEELRAELAALKGTVNKIGSRNIVGEAYPR